MNPLTEPCRFQNLLNIQQPNTSFSFLTREPSIELSSSAEEEHVMSDHKERRNWSPTEDIVLISAWLNTSKDPVVGNDQKAIAFWKRIAAYVAYSPKLFALQKREPSHCKQRWGKINESVCKFVGCYEAAMKAKTSGMSEDDVLKIKIGKIMRSCIILHNMIVEDERDGYTQYDVSVFAQPESNRSAQVDFTYSTDMPSNIGNMMSIRNRIRDKQIHQQLKADLVENIWQKFGTNQDFN
ncbi:hypothetical protein Bca4012_049288 [Brassica carinata]